MSDVVSEVQTKEFTELEFDQYLSEKLRVVWTKIEASKNFLRNGQQVLANEQLQGVADGVKHLVGNVEKRMTELGGDSDASDSN